MWYSALVYCYMNLKRNIIWGEETIQKISPSPVISSISHEHSHPHTDTHMNWLVSIDHRHHHPSSSLTLPTMVFLEAHSSAMSILSLGCIHHSEKCCFSTAVLDLTTGLVILRTTGPLLPDNFIISQRIFISHWMNLTHVTAARNQK